jgi:hypothetical protein
MLYMFFNTEAMHLAYQFILVLPESNFEHSEATPLRRHHKESYLRSELAAIAQPDIITINGRSGGKICERNLDDTSFDREERTQMTYSELIQIVFATYDTLVWNFKQYDIDGLFATHVFEQSKPTRTSAVSALATVALNGNKRSTMALK